MDTQSQSRQQHPVVRQLASLKLLSRLLGHELHAQGATKTVTLSRDEIIEIQTTVDLFIEEITRRQGQGHGMTATVQGLTAPAPQEPQLVASRN